MYHLALTIGRPAQDILVGQIPDFRIKGAKMTPSAATRVEVGCPAPDRRATLVLSGISGGGGGGEAAARNKRAPVNLRRKRICSTLFQVVNSLRFYKALLHPPLK
jgi:hypothetical protein